MQVVVQGIPWAYTDQDLAGLFQEVGTVEQASVVYSKDGRSRVRLPHSDCLAGELELAWREHCLCTITWQSASPRSMHELPSIQPWSLLIELPLTPSTLSVAVTSTDLHISQRAEPDDAVCRAMAQYASQQKRTRRRQLQTSMALTWRAAPLLSRLTSEPPLFPMYLPYHTPCSNHYPPSGPAAEMC